MQTRITPGIPDEQICILVIAERNPSMKMKHCVQVGILGRYSDRFTEYQPAKSLATRLASLKEIPGATGIELVYPFDFEDVEATKTLVREAGVAVAAVNLNVK